MPPRVSVINLIIEAIKSLFLASPVLGNPSNSFYSKRPSKPPNLYFFVAVILTGIGLLVSFEDIWLRYPGYTLSAFSAPILYLIWMFQNDRYEKDPRVLVMLTFGWGAFCYIFTITVNKYFLINFLGSAGAAFVEEPLKILGVYLIAKQPVLSSEFDDHLDGMIYGAGAGAGFAGLENLTIFLNMTSGRDFPSWDIVIRSVISFNHIAWSAIAGRSLGLAKVLNGKNRFVDLIPGLMVVIPLHFAWNRLSSPALMLFFFLFNLTALVRLVRTALNDEVRWGFLDSTPNDEK